MKQVKDPIGNKIQVAGEVNAVLNTHNIVIVTKSEGENPVYRIYADTVPDGEFTLQASLRDGQLENL
jgi:hypothetical protein